jgi:hypothetical protein
MSEAEFGPTGWRKSQPNQCYTQSCADPGGRIRTDGNKPAGTAMEEYHRFR